MASSSPSTPSAAATSSCLAAAPQSPPPPSIPALIPRRWEPVPGVENDEAAPQLTLLQVRLFGLSACRCPNPIDPSSALPPQHTHPTPHPTHNTDPPLKHSGTSWPTPSPPLPTTPASRPPAPPPTGPCAGSGYWGRSGGGTPTSSPSRSVRACGWVCGWCVWFCCVVGASRIDR